MNIQFLRNEELFLSKDNAISALKSRPIIDLLSDGGIAIARYQDADSVASVIGVYYKGGGGTVSVSILSEAVELITANISDFDSAVDAKIKAIDFTPYATKQELADEITKILNSAPEVLDTLGELSKALGDDPNFATTITNLISTKSDKGHTHKISDVEDLTTTIDSIKDGLSAEITRSTNEDTKLTNSINSEITRSTDEDKRLQKLINDKVTRLDAKDAELETNLGNETSRATAKENEINATLTSEITRSTNEDNRLDGVLTAEITRSTNEDARLDSAKSDKDHTHLFSEILKKEFSIHISRSQYNTEIAPRYFSVPYNVTVKNVVLYQSCGGLDITIGGAQYTQDNIVGVEILADAESRVNDLIINEGYNVADVRIDLIEK